MLHLYYCHLPELQTMRSVSGDYSLRAAVHHRYTFVLRLPTRLFSATKRTKSCLHVSSPTAIENSVQVLSTSGPSATATKSPSVQTVVPVESDVSSARAMPPGKDKFQNFVIPIRITVSGRLSSRLSAFFKSVGKCAASAPHHLESNPPPSKQRTLATGSYSDVSESSACLIEFTREKGCSGRPFSSELSGLLCGNDRPPAYTPAMPEPQDPEEHHGMPGGDAVTTKARHSMSLDPDPSARTDAYDATPGNRVIEHKKEKFFPNENVDDGTTCPMGETGLDLEVAPSSALALVSSSARNFGPTHEAEVNRVSRQPAIESNFVHFYRTLKPYISRHELSPRPVQRTPPPIDDGPLPESDDFRVLEGPFTTPPGGTSAPRAQGPPCAPLPLPTNSEVLHEREPEIKHSDPYPAPATAALTDPTSHQLVYQPVAPARLCDEVLGKTMTWDIDILHERAGFSQTLNSALRSMQIRWQILEFNWVFETSDASMFCDSHGFAFKPLALQLPYPSSRITEIDDENEPVPQEATGEIQSCNDGASGSGSMQAQQGSGSGAYVQQSRSTQLPRGKKRANEDDGDRKGKKKERREEPPVDNDPSPSPSDSEDEGVLCPYRVKDPRNYNKKSCISPKKNLSKLKEHLRRAHFLHLGCPFENCKFHAGDKFQINRHQKAAHAGEIREPIPRTTDSKLLRKNEALGTRNLTWDQIYDICFREEPEEPVMGLDGASGFESEDEEEGDETEEDDEDHESQEDRSDHEIRGGHLEFQGGNTNNQGAAAAVEENDQENFIPSNFPEASWSMLSNAAPTTIDTPGPFIANGDFPPGFFGSPWAGPLSGLSQDGGHLPSPTPDHDSFPGSGRPPLSSPADVVTWEMVEEHILEKFETFRGACFQGLGNRRTSPRAALADADSFFGEIWRSAEAALGLPNGGGGPVVYYSKDSHTFPVPYDHSLDQTLFQGPPIGGGSSTLPSLIPDSQSSHNSYSGGAVYDPYGDVLAHKNSRGRWSVGSGSQEMQPRFD